MADFSKPTHRGVRQGGYTIVEVMVASIIMAVSISAAVFMLLNSSSQRTGSDHYRQALAFLREETEDFNRHFFRYGGLALTAGPQGIETVNLDNVAHISGNVSLDIQNADRQISGITVPAKKLILRISWPENGSNSSITIVKIITAIQ
jgi:prepilin-type N-terminal cleavage/methylation domain-containing protein